MKNQKKLEVPPVPEDFLPHLVREPKFRAGQRALKVKWDEEDTAKKAKQAAKPASNTEFPPRLRPP